jgi:hypothetical protein
VTLGLRAQERVARARAHEAAQGTRETTRVTLWACSRARDRAGAAAEGPSRGRAGARERAPLGGNEGRARGGRAGGRGGARRGARGSAARATRDARQGVVRGGGRRRGWGGGEREGEGAHLGVQIRRSPSPKPRAPWGRERELCAGELNEEKETRGGGAAGGGAGRQGRAGQGRAGSDWVGLG